MLARKNPEWHRIFEQKEMRGITVWDKQKVVLERLKNKNQKEIN